MKRREVTQRLMATFLDELEEQIATMNDELLGLEAEPVDSGRIASLFRIAHTLKGASRAVQVRAVERVCHALEGFLQRMIDGNVAIGADQISLLYTAADTLREAGVQLAAEGAVTQDAAIDTLIDAIRSASVGRLPTRPTERSTMAAAEASSAPVAGGRPARVAEGRSAPTAEARPRPEAVTAAGTDGPGTMHSPNVPMTHDRQVRVNAERLDSLVAATTRLEGARSQVGARHTDLERASDLAARLDRRWRQLVRRLRRFDMASGSGVLEELDTAAHDLRTLADSVENLTAASRRSAHAVARASRDVVDSTRQLRMRPFAEACEGLPRAVRDLAAAAGRDVSLDIRGGTVEADRAILDGLREPILQLVRNAVDHGIEARDERERAGKPTAGHITIAAAIAGDRLAVTVADDGAGLDLGAIREQLERRGRVVPDDDHELARVIFEGGLSTREEVTDISGRGVGLDIVRHAAEQIRGFVSVTWEVGVGTTFTITCPPTLTIFRAVIVSVNEHLLAIPTSSVDRMLRVGSRDVRIAEGRRMLISTDGLVPLLSLAQLLPPLRDQGKDPLPVVVLRNGPLRIAVSVDELITEDEIVLRPLDPLIGHVPHISGAALLGPGRVALVLNPASLIGAASHAGVDIADASAWSAEQPITHTILVVDDSITTRTLEQSILAAAGYRVFTAVDGAEGWALLRERGADLVVADVEMPRMDGFALCEAIRGSQRFSELPVVLVTALDSAEHRARGMEAGADAYIIKSGFDQQSLLDTVRQLLA